jgi:hypothetical protein
MCALISIQTCSVRSTVVSLRNRLYSCSSLLFRGQSFFSSRLSITNRTNGARKRIPRHVNPAHGLVLRLCVGSSSHCAVALLPRGCATLPSMCSTEAIRVAILMHIRMQAALSEFIRSVLVKARILMSIAASAAPAEPQRAYKALDKALDCLELVRSFGAKLDDAACAAEFRSEAARIRTSTPLCLLLPDKNQKDGLGAAAGRADSAQQAKKRFQRWLACNPGRY